MLKDIKCPLCKNQKSCAIMGIGDYAVEKCGMFNPIEKPIRTNADRLRAMTDEELVEIFANNDCGYCRIHDFCFAKGSAINCEDVWLDWLKQEAEK